MSLEIEKYYEILRKSELFLDLDLEAILHIVNCLKGYIRIYKSGSVVLPYGSKTEYAGVVLSGKLALVIPEADGSETNMGNITESGFFACKMSVCLYDDCKCFKADSGRNSDSG